MTEKTKKLMRTAKVLKILSTIVLVLVLVFAMLIAGVRLFGLDLYVVLSGSMEPEYKTGSMVYVADCDVNELGVGDVITFTLASDPGTTATHRIVEVKPNENGTGYVFVTKGDANEDIDANPVTPERVVGKPVMCIPYLGKIMQFIQSFPGVIYAIAIGAGLVFLVVAAEIVSKEALKQKQKDLEEHTDGPRKIN